MLLMSSKAELLNGMNPRQKEAVLHTDGPLLLMAGAGSGKTRVLTHRIAYLIEEKEVNPWNILAITFTNKAAKEMKERVNAILASGGEDVWVSTFHSMCVRILRRDVDFIGYNRNFTIIDSSEQLTLMKRILKELNIDPKKYDPRSILGTISQAKNVLHLTQPTLSRQLKELEEELGTELFVRENRKMILTEAGYFLKKPSRRNFRFNESNHSRIREQKKTIIQRPIYDRLC
ncbi:hypothetical protein BU183_07395, partial [Enterococcus faecium]